MGVSFQAKNSVNFWSGKRVLITGHTGFKGSWLSLWLQSMDAELRGIALEAPTEPNMFQICAVGRGIDHKVCDILDFWKAMQAH